MNINNVADGMVETLLRAGVQRVYGIVGDSLNGFTEALRKSDVQWVHMRHEEAGAFAAGAEAQLTGNLTVYAGSCGAGNLHLINGLYDCHRSRVPVVAIAAHNRQELSMPPSITAEQQMKGFSLYALKAVMNGRGNELFHLAETNLLR